MARILIADDEPEVVQFCTYALAKDGHAVSSAETGTQALEKLRSDPPELLILDVMLPGMDGYTLQLQMAQDALLCNIPVVVITALKPAQGLFDRFEQVAAFLAKPFLAEDLQAAVKHALSDSWRVEKKSS